MIITVRGQHELRLDPEQATLQLSVEAEGDDPGEVTEQILHATRLVVDRLEELRAAGATAVQHWVVDALITSAWHPWGADGRPQPLRHRAQQSLQVVFTDFVALAHEAAGWAAVPGLVIRRVDWSVAEHTRRRHEAQVLGAAVEDAGERAAVMARAAGRKQIEFLELADPGLLRDSGAADDPPAPMMARRASRDGVEPVRLSPEPIVLSARVLARFEA